MNKKHKLIMAAGCMSMTMALLTGCGADEISDSEEVQNTGYTYQISAELETTRALSEDNKNILHSHWIKGDKLMAYNLSDKDKSRESNYSLLSSTNMGKRASFKGNFKTFRPITDHDNLCFFYPGAASTGKDRTISATKILEKRDDKGGYYIYHEKQKNIQNLVELNLTRQDGKASTIGQKFDYQWAKVKPVRVKGKDVSVKIGPMKRIIAIWGLRFADDRGKILTEIDSVHVSNVKSLDVFNLESGRLVENNDVNDESMNISVTPDRGKKLSSAKGKYTYVAILPGNYNDVLITVYAKGKCYSRNYEGPIRLEADKIYRTDVIQMKQVNVHPYVEVQGVKWATGNFIHYTDPKTLMQYWGIAPTQWWISRRVEKNHGNMVSSQFISSPVQNPNDLDLFRYGDIENALNVRSNTFKQGNWDISKKFFYKPGPIQKEVSRKWAKYGDIVWYYTEKNNQKYRMPNKAEMRTLYDKANVIPAFCYTDKGTKVYGAYFFTNNGEPRKKIFPIGVKKYYQYKHVTALVRANKGLFLPITGRRVIFQAIMGYRDMTYSLGAYGQYMSSKSYGSLLSYDMFFGPTAWNFSANGKGQAKAIRPVWDESSHKNKLDPVFKPFKNIK